MPALSRAALLRRSAGGGALLLVGAGLAAPADAADIPDGDLSYLRVLVAAELLKGDFHARALASRRATGAAARLLRSAEADDRAHYSGLAALLSGAGQTPAAAGDIDFTYPRGSFASQTAIARLASRVAQVTLGAYLGAVESVQTPELRRPLGQIAANEAQQLGALAQLRGRPVVGGAFAASLRIDAVSAALDEYES
jgi:hypothetical protein